MLPVPGTDDFPAPRCILIRFIADTLSRTERMASFAARGASSVTGTIMPLGRHPGASTPPTFVAAPFAGTCLAEFGADVIKIERPGVGDDLRASRHPERGGRHLLVAQRRAQQEVRHAEPQGTSVAPRSSGGWRATRGRGDRELPAGDHGAVGPRVHRSARGQPEAS